MKTMYWDIETFPNLAYVFGLWNENVPLERLIETASVSFIGWKWRGDKRFYCGSDFTGHREMLEAVHAALSEADLVVDFNGKGFDLPHVNREFLLAGMPPPAPFAHLDLYREVKRQFKFPSNKLQHLLQALGLEGKFKHSGFDLWKRCMANEASAWEEMETYNRRDVFALEDLHDRLSGWLSTGPNMRLFAEDDEDVCPQCGSKDLRREGYRTTAQGKYQRYQCRKCGGWSAATRSEQLTQVRSF